MGITADRSRHQVDLKSIHLAPFPELATFNDDLYSVTFNPVKSRNQKGFKWAFQGEEGIVFPPDSQRHGLIVAIDLFEFQEWMTGYKVVDD